jgi:hypothetical protein
MSSKHESRTSRHRTDVIAIVDMEDCPEFSNAIRDAKDALESSRIDGEACRQEAEAEHPEIGATLLECSDLLP